MEQKLGDLARRVVPLIELINIEGSIPKDPMHCHVVEYKTDTGVVFGRNIHNEEGFAIQSVFLPAGTNFPYHIHPLPSVEYCIVLDGEIEMTANGGKSKIYKYQDSFEYRYEEEHRATAITNVTLLCITVPRDLGYPE